MRGGRRIAWVAMVLVTAWSVWAWAAKPADKREHEPPVAAEAEEGPAPMNWTEFGGETPPFIAMLVNFGILAAGYYLLGRKPLAAGLVARREAIAKEIQDAQRMKDEAEARAKTYRGKLDRLEEELASTREALVRAGEAERDRIVAEAEAKAERMRTDAAFLVEQEMKQIRQDLWRDAMEAAVAAAEQLLAKRVTGADHERLAEEYLGELGGKPKSETRASESVRPPPAPQTGGPS